MGAAYPLTPVDVPQVDTKFRTIKSAIPHPKSVAIMEQLREAEPECMQGQPPILWDHAEGATIYDPFGNKWIDFSSGVLITNAGHGRQEMIDAIVDQAQHGLLTSYCFVNDARAELVAKLKTVAPSDDHKVMLISTGSEACEMVIKLSRAYGASKGKKPNVFVTFCNAFHGRTLGSQFAGGIEGLKDWIGYGDAHFVQVPFPDGGTRSTPEQNDFSYFEKSLADAGVSADQVCAVMTETYQGGNSSFAPAEYIQKLRTWCTANDALLIMDEVQAGFGRTGKFWGFEHYDIVPDLICCGKGISGSLPLSAVIGRGDVMDLFGPGAMTSTHSGNPICSAAALASLNIILDEKLHERAATIGAIMQEGCAKIQAKFSDVILAHHGKGLVASLHCVKAGTDDPDPMLAWRAVGNAVQKGLMFFGPVGYDGASVKLSPPLTIEEDALREAMPVLEESVAEAIESTVVA